MYHDFLVKIPFGEKTKKIVKIKQKGTTYIYFEKGRTYDKEKKYTRPDRVAIGKQDDNDDTMMYPNANFLKFFPDTELPVSLPESKRSSTLRAGAYIVIDKMLRESKIYEYLDNFFDPADKGLLMDMISYTIICENNAGQYYPDYAYCRPLFTDNMTIYSDSKISTFLRDVKDDQRIGFLNHWNGMKDHREKIYISYDATNKRCQAGDVEFAEYGNAKDDKSKPIINYSVAYDTNNREPLFYEEYPGSINDVSQLGFMIDKAYGYGYRNIGFIIDRGYYNRESFEFIDEKGFDFVIMIKGQKTLARKLIADVKGTFERKRANYIHKSKVSGITVKSKLYASDAKDRYFHIYYSLSKENRERIEFEDKLEQMRNQLNRHMNKEVEFGKDYEKYFHLYYDDEKEKVKDKDGNEKEILKRKVFLCGVEKDSAIEEEIGYQGYFVIITSAKMDAKKALELYNSRDTSEKLFRADKSFLDNHSYRAYSNEAVATKIFIAFLALIVRNRIFTHLQDEKEKLEKSPNYMTVPAAIKELEKIEMVVLSDGIYRQAHAVTKTQKTILKAFGMDEKDIKNSINKIQKALLAAGTRGDSNG